MKRSQLWYPRARYKRFLISLASEKKDDEYVLRARVCVKRDVKLAGDERGGRAGKAVKNADPERE